MLLTDDNHLLFGFLLATYPMFSCFFFRPYWWATGPIHGLCLALLGLIGDLTASMLKRDAGLKDFGDLLPEHGGIMDRVDSYIFTAPYSWLVLTVVLPWLKYGRKYVFQG